ncbi:MAG: AAA family ATPase [Bacteroidales bacterium]|jgi:exonuclease SbcC|nr:AAA family ATPase [Bacteroidales bacterium]
MKILAIRGKNLASLEGFFKIDFEQEPLKSAGIFAITGSTGAGKSTLLDALSLALYDQTPRMNTTAESVSIIDVKDKTINHKDSRNVLRRGTGEGFAEVDFLSLEGKPYRSLWRVKRANSKIDGSLQKTEMIVTDLTSGNELQGTKTELLTQIIALTGLTFEQFSRAVLLAQGDFASFLKAKSNEKAELLEKLTGTDIYSRISIAIYEKAKQAKMELELLEEKIKGIELLSEEEEKTLHTEMSEIVQQLNLYKKEVEIIDNKLKWYKEARLLCRAEQEAQILRDKVIQLLEEAKPRREWLFRMDQVQEIRDQYLQWKQGEKQIQSHKEELIKKKTEQKETEKLLIDLTMKWEALTKEITEIDQRFSVAEPEIIKARALDITIKHTLENETKYRKELGAILVNKEKIEKSIASTNKILIDIKENTETINQWFAKWQSFAEIADTTKLIISFADNLQLTGNQLSINKKSFQENEKIIQKDKKKLEVLETEAGKLDQLLPVEISVLRAKLIEGEPCPVCGSRHHPLDVGASESKWKEDEIAKAKEQNGQEREMLSKTITERQGENYKLSGLIQTLEMQINDLRNTLTQKLQDFPGWEKLFDEGVLQNRLEKRANEWRAKKERKEKMMTETALLSENIKNDHARLSEILKEEVVKKDELSAIFQELSTQRQDRAQLLNGQPADEVAKQFSEKKKKLQASLEESVKLKETMLLKCESGKGIIQRIQNDIEKEEQQKKISRQTVEEWLSVSDHFKLSELADLIQHDLRTVAQEKKHLHELNQRHTVAEATLAERKKKREEHHKSMEKPKDDEPLDVLSQAKNEHLASSEVTDQRKTAITVSLTHHQQGKAKMAQYDKQLLDKRLVWENIERINELFGSANGAKFKAIAQGYTLDALLKYANIHLKELSHRYKLQRIPDSLALQVVDLDMLNEIRSVHSLSGGESFLVSLALALGLSSLSSSRMKIESLFIDEGFGSLDLDTLRMAMDALEHLQSQGRKIGVISHVAEMTERIATQIRIVKETNGKSRVEIAG